MTVCVIWSRFLLPLSCTRALARVCMCVWEREGERVWKCFVCLAALCWIGVDIILLFYLICSGTIASIANVFVDCTRLEMKFILSYLILSYLIIFNQCWNIAHSNLRNKIQWNLKESSCNFTQENAFENVVCEMETILYVLNFAVRTADYSYFIS